MAAPKGTRKNSQAKGSDRDEAPESGGKGPHAEGATGRGKAPIPGISQAKNGGANTPWSAMRLFVSPRKERTKYTQIINRRIFMSELKRTQLYDAHVKAGATMVDFGGWEMPVQ